MVPPCIVLIFYHDIPGIVNKCDNISLPVFSVQICSAIVYYARHARIIIEKLDSVALFDNTVVAIIGIVYIPFAQPPAQPVIRERRGVVVYHLTPVAPTYALATVLFGIPYIIIFARFRAVGEQLVPVVLVLHAFELALLYVFFQRERRFSLAKDIPVVVITVQPRFAEQFIIFANQTVQCVVLVPYHGLAVLVDVANVAHLIVHVFDAFRNREFISALFAVIHRARHICGMVAHFAVINILRR